jgi:ligand-binding SRPBCC domain-containing protein
MVRTLKSTHIEFEDWVPFPIESVFDFFSNPENLPRIMPAASATRIIELKRVPPRIPGPNPKAAGTGSRITTSFLVFPYLLFRAAWTACITEFEWNHHFADVQQKGPFKSWHHRHEFATQTRDGVNGTIIRDIIDYEVGLRFLGRIANALFLRRQIESTFAQRQQALPKLLSEKQTLV